MKNHVQTKQITYEKNVNAINKKVLCYRKKKTHKKTNHCSIHLNPLLHTCHPLKCTFLALTRNGLVPAAAAVHWLVGVVCFLCGQWSGTPSNQLERNLQKNGKKLMSQNILYFIHLLISLPYIIQIILNKL